MFLAFYYILTGLVWLYRARRALRALEENPVIQSGFFPSPLPPSPPPLVSILLPVKNEEENLEACLKALLNQDYPSLEIIVINDHSIDRTGEILSKYSNLYPEKIHALDAPPLPAGWTGKNWALAHGVKTARGEWFLFTDADTRHERLSVSSTLSHADLKDLDLVTLSPRCLTEGFWEKTIQPPAMAFMGLWFPFARINNPSSPAVFGNGQYLLIRRNVYGALGGHEKVKGAFLEDFALVKEAKQKKFRVECAIGTKVFGTRMYRSIGGIWLGWRRIYLHAFEKNSLQLFFKSVLIFAFSVLPFLLFPLFTQTALEDPERLGRFWGAAFPILALIGLTAWKSHAVVGAPRRYALLHPLAGLILSGILVDAAWIALQKKEVRWR